VGVRAAGALPCGPGIQVLQVHNVMGRQTEVTLTATECELDRLITLQTPTGARPGVRQAYRLQPTGDGGCRLDFHLALNGVPRMAEHLVKAGPAGGLRRPPARQRPDGHRGTGLILHAR
jgi:hypothetical protein